MVPVSSATWQDAQHRYMAIAQRAVQRRAPDLVARYRATGRIRIRPIHIRPTPRLRAVALGNLVLSAEPGEQRQTPMITERQIVSSWALQDAELQELTIYS